MNFTRGNLTRRLRSAPVPNQSCSMDSGCLTEVVSKTFTEIVLDNNKVRCNWYWYVLVSVKAGLHYQSFYTDHSRNFAEVNSKF